MPPPFTRRLAGIQFVNQPPQLPEKLPRMDIAIFAGFAAAGPLDRAVPVEDAAQFTAIFGDDLPLAWDAEKGRTTFACLAPAVRAFFRNGGHRCWVVRVAGKDADAPETDLFPLPGLARVDGARLHPAVARARSPGSWFDGFRAAAALSVRGFALLDWEPDWGKLYVRLARQDDLGPGDLIRLRSAGAREETFFLVHDIETRKASPPESARSQFTVEVELLGTLAEENAAEFAGALLSIKWERADGTTETALGSLRLSTGSPPEMGEGPMALDVSPGFSPPSGTLLELAWTNGLGIAHEGWFQVDESEFNTATGSPPSGNASLVGRAFSWKTQDPAASVPAELAAERLNFELRIHRGETNSVRAIDLGFAPGHSRYWNALPDDAQLFGGLPPEIYEALWTEAAESRFPLAGDRSPGACFIPIGMSALAVPALGPENSGRAALQRDGLAHFSSALFLDARLVDSGVSTLIADADCVRYQTSGALPLTGIHAALDVEEASLIAVPDAIWRGWHAIEPKPAPPPIPSEPRPHPSWWHFLECDPPASPPVAEKPDRGEFLDSDLRVLEPPTLSVDGPDPAGAFTLQWSDPDAEVEFILEEATTPDFAGAVELWRGAKTSFTILSRPAGAYYYRVRAEAGSESSNWSNGEVVETTTGPQWELEKTADFADDTLLDIHRSLLRFCAARADIMAVLALPEHFRADDALVYLRDLKNSKPPAGNWSVRPLDSGEETAFSYGAVYHPWVLVREEAGDLLWNPPDGAASGLIAARSIVRGAWIAPANELFAGLVSLAPRFHTDRYFELLLAQLNLIRQEPRGFVALNADTLSSNEELRPINVRRLLILIRRVALRLGPTYVFEPNDLVLRRVVQGAFESIMHQLFMRGAFAGATPATSYQVVTDDSLNTPRDVDNGRFRVDLKVAPALPMSFLTVRLVQVGERSTATEII